MNTTLNTSEALQAKRGHGHLFDLGLSSLIAYFFCVLSSVSIRSGGLSAGAPDGAVLVAFLSFLGAVCPMLLFLGMAEPYMLRHDNHARLAFASGALLTLGPVVCVIELVTGASSSLLLFMAFALSGCGYALCLLVWGRILSVKNEDRSSRQVLADTCAAVIVMVVVSVVPDVVGTSIMACLGLAAGLIGARKAVAASAEDVGRGQVVVSDTRDVIPGSSYFVGGTLWLIYGVFWALLGGGERVFGGSLHVAEVGVVLLAAAAGIVIIRMHRNPNIDLSKALWVSVPLLVSGLAFFVAGEGMFLRLVVVLVVLSMVVSHLHLMSHFAALAHRPDLLSDQLFAWGWLAPYAGMFVGVFVGILCRLVGDPAIKIFIPVMVGVLVVTLIVSMRSIDKIAARRREREAVQRVEEASRHAEVPSVDYEAQMDEVFSDIGLSPREKEVAFLLLQGHSQAAIGGQLFVASSTVNTHVKHIYRRADVRSKQEFIDLCQGKLSARLDTLDGVADIP